MIVAGILILLLIISFFGMLYEDLDNESWENWLNDNL